MLLAGVGGLSLARLRCRVAEERFDCLARLGAALLLELRDPAGHGRDHLARSLLRRLFRGLFRRSFLRFLGRAFAPLDRRLMTNAFISTSNWHSDRRS